MAMKKYALWGLPRGSVQPIDERVLLSEATAEQCSRIERIAAKAGWHRFRRQLLDDAPPDFAGTVNV